MADRSVVEFASCLATEGDPQGIRGICHRSASVFEGCLELPSFEQAVHDKDTFIKMFSIFHRNTDHVTARPLAQKQDTRYLIQTPPAPPLSGEELDAVHGLDYERDVHPYYRRQGGVKALNTIRFSIATHRGCYGECNFCAITAHQGRTVTWRSISSIVKEAERFTRLPHFRGIIQDVGGPTANMYGIECSRKEQRGCCPEKRCLFPKICTTLPVSHERQMSMLRALRAVKGVTQVIIASGIRHDLIMADRKHGRDYLTQVIRHHVSGQMKIAPEHSEPHVLEKMSKSGRQTLLSFRNLFFDLTKGGKDLFLTYYLIAAHPGCTDDDMARLRSFALRDLRLLPEQVQIFTPTPSTWSTVMYWTERDPFTGEPCFVEKTRCGRQQQKDTLADRRKRRFS
jgi:uncharacterized radical SAM protein YgiQ